MTYCSTWNNWILNFPAATGLDVWVIFSLTSAILFLVHLGEDPFDPFWLWHSEHSDQTHSFCLESFRLQVGSPSPGKYIKNNVPVVNIHFQIILVLTTVKKIKINSFIVVVSLNVYYLSHTLLPYPNIKTWTMHHASFVSVCVCVCGHECVVHLKGFGCTVWRDN